MFRSLIIASLALVAFGFSLPAQAQWTGSTYGNQTYWNNSSGYSVICSRYGSQTYCN